MHKARYYQLYSILNYVNCFNMYTRGTHYNKKNPTENVPGTHSCT